jgi:hypothetical protein
LANGRFRPKLSQSVRVSTRSISYNVGVRVPIVPGRANLYVGGLARLERAQGKGFGQGRVTKVVNSIAKRLGDAEGNSTIARLIKNNDIDLGGITLKRSPVLNSPTVRIQKRAVGSRATIDQVPQATPRRARTRKRSSDVRVASTASGIKTKGPKAIARKSKGSRPQRRTAIAQTRGRRIK